MDWGSFIFSCPLWVFVLPEIIDKYVTLDYSFNIMEILILSVFVCVLLISRDMNLLLENLVRRQQLAIQVHFSGILQKFTNEQD